MKPLTLTLVFPKILVVLLLVSTAQAASMQPDPVAMQQYDATPAGIVVAAEETPALIIVTTDPDTFVFEHPNAAVAGEIFWHQSDYGGCGFVGDQGNRYVVALSKSASDVEIPITAWTTTLHPTVALTVAQGDPASTPCNEFIINTQTVNAAATVGAIHPDVESLLDIRDALPPGEAIERMADARAALSPYLTNIETSVDGLMEVQAFLEDKAKWGDWNAWDWAVATEPTLATIYTVMIALDAVVPVVNEVLLGTEDMEILDAELSWLATFPYVQAAEDTMFTMHEVADSLQGVHDTIAELTAKTQAAIDDATDAGDWIERLRTGIDESGQPEWVREMMHEQVDKAEAFYNTVLAAAGSLLEDVVGAMSPLTGAKLAVDEVARLELKPTEPAEWSFQAEPTQQDASAADEEANLASPAEDAPGAPIAFLLLALAALARRR